jgi:hypothetical protein
VEEGNELLLNVFIGWWALWFALLQRLEFFQQLLVDKLIPFKKIFILIVFGCTGV